MPLVEPWYGSLKRIEDHLSAPLAVGVEHLHCLHRLRRYSIEVKCTIFVNKTVGQPEGCRAGEYENA